MSKKEIQLTVKGMDCTGCANNVKSALEQLEEVESVEVFLSAEKAKIQTKNNQPDIQSFKKVVEDIGYHIPDKTSDKSQKENESLKEKAQKSFRLFGLVFGAILLVVIAGEWLGLFQALTEWVPFWAGATLVLLMGYPVFKQVIVAAKKGLVTPHALMALGSLTALAAGEWVTAGIVVFFMRTGDYIENYTTEKARDSLRSLTKLAPQTATVLRDGTEKEIPIDQVKKGDHILVRPGGKIPVDGTVIDGQATIDESPITGESMPIEKTEGSSVFASTIAQGGFLTLRAEAIGSDSTFGKIINMVEEAESQKGAVQRYADKFSAWYLPVVSLIAVLTYLISGDLMATVAVMVVACACAFALATPVALLASVGSNAKRGVLIKGGKYIEALARADVLLIDKTGTLTFGRPEISKIIPLNGITEGELLIMAASAEQYSDHPLGKAVVEAARKRHLNLQKPDNFEEITANGVRASFEDYTVTVGNERLLENGKQDIRSTITSIKEEGKTAIIVQKDGRPIGVLAAQDAERSEAGIALKNLREQHSFGAIELLTGDNTETARHLANKLNIDFRAELLPEDKINIVKQYQSNGQTVVMIGDGVNDAPALAQADVGIAMGTTGTDVAIETADITLMRDDWNLVPELFMSANKTMGIIKWNFGFTTVYNLVGLSLAAFGILPPVLAAAAQSLPDVGILLNSSRLLTK
ncbi:cation-translocating P-type ATPase [Fodinibius sp.]|uniref:heavy metal translocating P-type ATPase n=1 Tax=Fodinibius sp. TaxID=1872440 RepID=UPI002ACE787E|nr:cation-translocating P-type ATPase [Fodinibius sp.]MDZ7659739.1 cation-translocating P-type ATPase [Fodinibius sp.]